MSIIKSAYELAMERASNIKIDPSNIKEKELEKKGRMGASSFLNNPKFEMDSFVSSLPEQEKPSVYKGILWTLKANIKLPNSTVEVDKILKVKECTQKISSKTELIENIFSQIMELFQKYIDSSTQLLEQCKDEFAPRLAQKAQEVERQTGRQIQIDPETDREFIEFQRKNQEQLDSHFKNYLNQLIEAMDGII